MYSLKSRPQAQDLWLRGGLWVTETTLHLFSAYQIEWKNILAQNFFLFSLHSFADILSRTTVLHPIYLLSQKDRLYLSF